jgi:hypothetical protein
VDKAILFCIVTKGKSFKSSMIRQLKLGGLDNKASHRVASAATVPYFITDWGGWFSRNSWAGLEAVCNLLAKISFLTYDGEFVLSLGPMTPFIASRKFANQK